MKYIIAIICSIILPIFSLKENVLKPKLCVNCKFFRNDDNDNKYGKCALFPRVENKLELLVTEIENIDYTYASIARKYFDMCGEEGKMYKKFSKREDFIL